VVFLGKSIVLFVKMCEIKETKIKMGYNELIIVVILPQVSFEVVFL
jgi:hypothetical protein